MKLYMSRDQVGARSFWMWCPGCDEMHRISDQWVWDGDEAAPTFTPSILVRGLQWAADSSFHRATHASVPTGGARVCHSFLVAGVWQFLGDCTHALANQHVPMVDLPAWFADSLGPSA